MTGPVSLPLCHKDAEDAQIDTLRLLLRDFVNIDRNQL